MSKLIHELVQTRRQELAQALAREQELAREQAYAQACALGVAAATRAIAAAYPDEVAAALYARAYARAACLYWQRAPLAAESNPLAADLQNERLAAARRAEREFPEMGAYDLPTRGAIVELALAYALNFDIDGSP